MAKIRKIYDQTIKPDGSKTTIYPITSTRAVYTPEGETLDSYLKDGYFHGADLAGYKVVYNVYQLPTTETSFGYLMDSNLYVWVGTGGNTLDGKYQNCGPFRGPQGYDGHDGTPGRTGSAGLQGPKGEKGDKGDSGVDLGQVTLTTALAETETGKALDASVAQYKIGFVDDEQEIEDVPSNYYNRQEVDQQIDVLQSQINSIHPNIVYGDVNNVPDEEDLTTDSHGLLKFKDRAGQDGMAYYILRKDKSFAEQVVHPNAVYEIRYDFDLNSDTAEIPSGSILKFNGGKISNGTLAGANTSIDATLVQIFGTDITLSGSWNVEYIYPEWFGAIANGSADSTVGIQKAVDAASSAGIYYVYFTNGTYNVSDTINIGPYVNIVGAVDNQWNTPKVVVVQTSQKPVFSLASAGGNAVCFDGLAIKFANSVSINENCIGIELFNNNSTTINRRNLKFSRLHIEKCYYGISAIRSSDTAVLGYLDMRDSTILSNVYGIYVSCTGSSWMNTARFKHVHFNSNKRGGAYINCPYTYPIIFDDCCIEGNGNLNTDTYEGYGIYFTRGIINITNTYFENNFSGKLNGAAYDKTSEDQLLSANVILTADTSINFENNQVIFSYNNIVYRGYNGFINSANNSTTVKHQDPCGLIVLATNTSTQPTLSIKVKDFTIATNISPIVFSPLSVNSNYDNVLLMDIDFCYPTERISYRTQGRQCFDEPIIYIGTQVEGATILYDKSHPVPISTAFYYLNRSNRDLRNNRLCYWLLENTSISTNSAINFIDKNVTFVGNSATITFEGISPSYINLIGSDIIFKNASIVIGAESNTGFVFKGGSCKFYDCTIKVTNNVRFSFSGFDRLLFYNCTFADDNVGRIYVPSGEQDKVINEGGNIVISNS